LNQIIRDFNSRIAFLGLTKQEIADRIHKDLSTVNQQLNPKVSNPQLSTLIQYAELLGGALHFVTPESAKAIEDANISAYRDRLQELGHEVASLKDQINAQKTLLTEKDSKLQRREETIKQHEETMYRLRRIIDRKEEDIARKDKRIAQLMDKILGE